ncbi:MAG: hypothetical protein GY910_13605 [bacterium]|nr:hypothetical protein [Deltaproteobacteria bacterium]MCP4906007.1 hypothetical protein [bacterium]
MDERRSAWRLWRAAFEVGGPIGLAAYLFLAGALAAGSASAQYSFLDDDPPRFEWRSQAETFFRNDFGSKSDGGDEFDAWQLGVVGEVEGPINESVLVGFRGGYRYASYDFDLGNPVPLAYEGTALPREPWNPLHTIDLAPSATLLVGSQVSVITTVPIRWAGEAGADKNGFTAGISALIRWQVNNGLSVGAGIGITSQLEDEAETFPIISLRWRISENLELATEGSWLQGGRAALFWGASNSIRFSFSAGYERTRFRLDDHGLGADRNGIGEVTTIPIEIGLRLQFVEEAYFDLRAGLGVEGRVRVETDGGRKLYDQQYDPTPRVGFSLVIPFGLPN